jgi:hypothetical protein
MLRRALATMAAIRAAWRVDIGAALDHRQLQLHQAEHHAIGRAVEAAETVHALHLPIDEFARHAAQRAPRPDGGDAGWRSVTA